MNSIHIHNVAKIETIMTDFEDFTTKDLIITNDKGEQFTVALFSKIPGALETAPEEAEKAPEEAQKAPEEPSIFLDILESLKTWGLSSHPDLHKLAFKLAVEADQGLDIGLKSPNLGGAFLWSRTTDGHAYWDAIDVFAQNNRY
jgi:hypothetical protein